MYLVAIAWCYVVVMWALVEAFSPGGSMLGAFFTLLLYGLLPASVLLYIMGAPMRWRRRKAEQAADVAVTGETATNAEERGAEAPAQEADPGALLSAAQPDCGDHPPSEAIAPKREEP